MPGLIHQIKKTIRQWEMLSKGETVIAAVSGGADSVVMLHILLELGDELGIKAVVAHMDHGLRGAESRRDHDFVKALAKRLKLEFVSRRLKKGELKALGGSPQEAARLMRYAFLEEAASIHNASRVALGHTMDDQAETVLMRMMKGSSVSGLSGIPPKRSIFIRPLIQTSRREIEDYARAKGIGFIVDSTNLSPKYLRNSIRLELIPFIEKKYNPSIKETLARTALILSEEDDFLEQAALKASCAAVIGKTEDKAVLDRKRLLRLHPAVLSRVFLDVVHSLGIDADFGSVHASSFEEILKGRRPNASVSLPGGLSAIREYDRIIISKEAGAAGFNETLVKVPGTTVVRGAGSVEARIMKPPKRFDAGPATAWFDLDEVAAAGELRARQARPGDRMVPFGMNGHRKLKDIFIDAKVPLSERRRTPVVVAGHEIIWVAGLRQAAAFSVTRATVRALRLDFIKERF